MHFEEKFHSPLDPNAGPWHKGLTKYHWFVLVVAALGWLFDTMDQQLFNLARRPAITELITPKVDRDAPEPTPDQAKAAAAELAKDIDKYGGITTSVFMVGWALGGLFFGILGDRIGRAKTMLFTILIYSIFTGLSALSVGVVDFACYRFLTGLGVGGEFAVGVSLVAEVMPDRARPFALGWLQALSAVGNMTAALIAIVLGKLEEAKAIGGAWRIMFIIGTLPALLAIVIRSRLKEPERWQKVAKSEDGALPGAEPKLGSLRELFGNPRWRKNTIVGMLLAFSGVVGLWGIGFFSFDLIRLIFRRHFEAQGLSPEAIKGQLTFWTGITSLVQNAGGFLGIYAFSRVTAVIGRKPAFAISYVIAMISTAFTFWFVGNIFGFADIFWMVPVMGFCQLTLFGGFAIYFPELFPTRLRSTGTSFCYNVGRLVAAVGPTALGLLTSEVYGRYKSVDAALPFRYAGVTMSAVFLIGLAVLPFAPETKGKPLPE